MSLSNNPDHLSQLIQVSRKGSEPDLSGDLDSVGMRQDTQERYGNWWIPCPLISILSSSDGACVGATNLRKERWCQALHGSTQEGARSESEKQLT